MDVHSLRICRYLRAEFLRVLAISKEFLRVLAISKADKIGTSAEFFMPDKIHLA